MKVNDVNLTAETASSAGRVSSAAGVGGYGPGGRKLAAAGLDQVQLSGASQFASSALVAHADRVNELKGLVASGQYGPSAQAVGKGIIEEALTRG